jgi:glutamate synthase (NADPH/NADH) small chain
VIIGGGDTGADCLGTVHRQGARSVHQFEVLPRPPDTRAEKQPVAAVAADLPDSGAHEEGGERLYSVSTTEFVGDGDGRVQSLRGVSVVPAQENGRMVFKNVPGQRLLARVRAGAAGDGLHGPERSVVDQLGVKLTDRGTVWRDEQWMTSVPGVFTAGDMQRGQSLIVWAIAEGRSAARGVDQWLTGHSQLPAPLQ